jgi:hypothetical protein
MIYVVNNPLYLLVGFLIFYYLVAEPIFGFDLIRALLLYIVLYFVYVNYGDKIMQKLSNFGKRR